MTRTIRVLSIVFAVAILLSAHNTTDAGGLLSRLKCKIRGKQTTCCPAPTCETASCEVATPCCAEPAPANDCCAPAPVADCAAPAPCGACAGGLGDPSEPLDCFKTPIQKRPEPICRWYLNRELACCNRLSEEQGRDVCIRAALLRYQFCVGIPPEGKVAAEVMELLSIGCPGQCQTGNFGCEEGDEECYSEWAEICSTCVMCPYYCDGYNCNLEPHETGYSAWCKNYCCPRTLKDSDAVPVPQADPNVTDAPAAE